MASRPEPVIIRGNETLLKQMIYNLVENAIRYNRENGRVFVEVYAEDVVGAEDASGRGFRCTVLVFGRRQMLRRGSRRLLRCAWASPRERHGRGYSRRQAGENLRALLSLGEKSLQRAGRHGLGLAIVKHAALYHGGEVSVESEEDVGTRFTVRLPIG